MGKNCSFHEQAKKANLKVNPLFWKLSDKELLQYKCGPGDGVLEKAVPETAYGLYIRVCCVNHDIDWQEALESYERTGNLEQFRVDIERANERFLVNLIRFINTYSTPLLKGPRRYRATTYYNAVEDIGRDYYIKEHRANG